MRGAIQNGFSWFIRRIKSRLVSAVSRSSRINRCERTPALQRNLAVYAPYPPSTARTAPVTNDACGLARNTAPAAISSGRAYRPRALPAFCHPEYGPVAGFMLVSGEPTETTLTVVPLGPRSRAAPLL